jgi:SAM-dependent methyltransferase
MENNLENRLLFDEAAEAYDRYRPIYPREAIDRVISFARLKSSSRLLEVGAGPGKASVLFAARGFTIDCLEPGVNLAARARANLSAWPKASVIIQKFEDYTASPEYYNLIYAAQSFHWIDPAVRFRKARTLLTRNGTIAIIYNYTPAPEKGLSLDLRRAIETASSGAMKTGNYEDEISRWSTRIKEDELFFDLQVERFRWRDEYTAEQYAGLLGTYSSFLALQKPTQQRVLTAVAEKFNAYKEPLIRDGICVVFLARKNRRRLNEYP